jgi:pullulanase
MYQEFGATVDRDSHEVTFRLFLPDNRVDPAQYTRGGPPKIRAIRVRGDFQHLLDGEDWGLASAPDMVRQPHPHGWLWSCTLDRPLPDGFYQYKYFVAFENGTTRWVTDPCTKYGGSGGNENSAFVVGGHRVDVQPIPYRRPPQELVLYELMIDNFTQAYRGDRAPVDAVHDRLDYLQALGINAIEFMPWTAWPGDGFSWGYDPFQFFAVEHRYVNDSREPADKIFRLKKLINELHGRGIQVIMDGVFNHVRAGLNPNKGFPYLWLYQDPEDSPYIGPFERGGFFEDFDFNNPCTEQFIHDVCVYWLDTYQLDGIRFDYTIGFYRSADPAQGIARLIADLRAHLAGHGRENVALIIEHLTDNRYEAIDATNRIGATACWFDPLMYASQGYARTGRLDNQALRVLNSQMDFAPGRLPVTYIENHDHSTIVNVAGGRGRWYKSQPAAIALLTAPGLPMIHNGQEFGVDEWLPEFGDGRVLPRPLRWDEQGPDSGDLAGRRLYELYQKLITIRQAHPGLRSAHIFPAAGHPDGYGRTGDSVIIYHRYGPAEDGRLERFIVVLNFGDWDQAVTIPFSTNGRWHDLLNDIPTEVWDYRLYGQTIPSNWGRIYYQKAAG